MGVVDEFDLVPHTSRRTTLFFSFRQLWVRLARNAASH